VFVWVRLIVLWVLSGVRWGALLLAFVAVAGFFARLCAWSCCVVGVFWCFRVRGGVWVRGREAVFR